MDLSAFLTTESLISLLTLTVLEIVLGIDNVIFIALLANRLPVARQESARRIGMLLAMFVRVGLLFSITWLVSLTKDLITIGEVGLSGRDLILLGGGLFLIGKTVTEIHHKLEGEGIDEESKDGKGGVSFSGIIVQIVLIDIVFSFDSILTAVGVSKDLPIMITAVVISIGLMMFFAGAISAFIEKHPTIKMMALAFLIMIGFLLVLEAFEVHVQKGYLYFAIAFAMGVEFLNMALRKKSKRPVKMHDEHLDG